MNSARIVLGLKAAKYSTSLGGKGISIFTRSNCPCGELGRGQRDQSDEGEHKETVGEDGTAAMTEETSHALANARLSLAHSFFMSHAPQRVGLDCALAFGGVSAGG